MADLERIDKLKLEKYLDMGMGYVCDFNNATFTDFVLENTGIDIFVEKYNFRSGSKANRLRSFWDKESNYLVAKLLKKMIEYWRVQKINYLPDYPSFNRRLYNECVVVVSKLGATKIIEDADSLNIHTSEEIVQMLISSIRESINKGEPYQALDRLHTFIVKHIRELCKRHSITFTNDTSLHALFGTYRKFLEKEGIIKSEMTERILKSTISILESFNTIRNEKSLAHDNSILSQQESALIVSNVFSILKFISVVEKQLSEKSKKDSLHEFKGMPADEEMEAAADQWIQIEIDRRRGK